jgi:iron complex transport system permease protein
MTKAQEQMLVWRVGHRSLRAHRRTLRILVLLVALLTLSLGASVMVGEYALRPGEVLGAIVGAGDDGTAFIVRDLRLPRALVGMLAGAALGVAGAVFQEVTRNPLVSPDIVGVSHGASAAAAAVIVLTSWEHALAVPAAALIGALAAGGALAALAWRGGIAGYRVVLVGIGLAALLHAAISYVLTKGRIFEVSEAYVWLVGTINGRSWVQVVPLAVAVMLLLPCAIALSRRLDALTLGDDLARSLGVRVERVRAALLCVATALTAAAVAAAGPIGFVAFLSPHLARRLLATSSAQSLVPAAAACGALLVLVADLAARLAFAPTELPVGLVTSVLAAPYFLWLLQRGGRIGATG